MFVWCLDLDFGGLDLNFDAWTCILGAWTCILSLEVSWGRQSQISVPNEDVLQKNCICLWIGIWTCTWLREPSAGSSWGPGWAWLKLEVSWGRKSQISVPNKNLLQNNCICLWIGIWICTWLREPSASSSSGPGWAWLKLGVSWGQKSQISVHERKLVAKTCICRWIGIWNCTWLHERSAGSSSGPGWAVRQIGNRKNEMTNFAIALRRTMQHIHTHIHIHMHITHMEGFGHLTFFESCRSEFLHVNLLEV